MDIFVRTVRGLSLLCGIAAASLIASAVVIVCQMVFIRYVLNENTIWNFVTYASPTLMTKGHVNVDVLPMMVGERARLWLAIVATIVSLVFALVMTVLTFQFWWEAWENNWVSDSMWRARLWIPYGSMPIGLGVLTLQYIVDLLELVTGRVRPFGGEATA